MGDSSKFSNEPSGETAKRLAMAARKQFGTSIGLGVDGYANIAGSTIGKSFYCNRCGGRE